jgi:hypothetical protein
LFVSIEEIMRILHTIQLVRGNYSPEDGQGIGEGRKGWPERARERARRGLRACLRAVER